MAASAMALRDFSRSLPMLLLRSHQAVMAQFRPILRRHRITEQQWRVLRALTAEPALRITQLAELTLISKPSLSRIIRTLERRKLVSRSTPQEDQRAAQIAITRSGLELIEQVAPHSEQRYRNIAERFGPQATAQLYELLQRLPAALEAAGAADTAAKPVTGWRDAGTASPDRRSRRLVSTRE
jgi:homoprotocatechuate degradation regulator HpaR